MIMGYRNVSQSGDALLTFERMHSAGVPANRVTFVNTLAACSSHRALDMGVWIHDHIRRSGLELDVRLGSALVDMYCKCGRIGDGIEVFLSMKVRNVYTWNSVIGGLAAAKCGKEALRWFSAMEVEPDGVTLIEVLCACSHSGLVEDGWRIFDCLVRGEFGFSPGIKHYGCMVDLLGRAGCLDDAVEFIERMPYEPNVVIWGSLLGGCRSHNNMRMSENVVKRLVELEPWNVAHYILLSKLYSEMGRWRDVEEVRRVMKKRGLRKDAVWSLPEEIHCS